MESLLERLHRLHSLFEDKPFQDISLTDILSALSEQVPASFILCLPTGEVLELGGKEFRSVATKIQLDPQIAQHIPGLKHYELNSVVLPGIFTPEGTTPGGNVNISFFPAYSNQQYLCCLTVWKYASELSPEDAVLCESVATIIGLAAGRAHNTTPDQYLRDSARVSAGLLSHSERFAVKELLKLMKADECTVNVSNFSSRIHVTRSIITSALRKLQGSEVITVRSLGVRGTYVRIENPYFYDAIAVL